MYNNFRNFCVSAFVAALGAGASAQTQEPSAPKPEYRKTSLTVMATSKHLVKDWYHDDYGFHDYNEFNPGWGIEYRFSKHFHATGGVYLNSVNDISFAAVAGTETAGDKWIGAGAEAGAASGYLRYKVTPVVLAFLRVGNRDHFNVRVNVMPGDLKKAVVLSLEARIPVRFARFHP